jgi:hypothetical protein
MKGVASKYLNVAFSIVYLYVLFVSLNIFVCSVLLFIRLCSMSKSPPPLPTNMLSINLSHFHRRVLKSAHPSYYNNVLTNNNYMFVGVGTHTCCALV